MGDDKVLKGWTKRKLISQKMSLSLIEVADKKRPREKTVVLEYISLPK